VARRNQEEFLKFSGSSQVASRNRLLRIHATSVAMVAAQVRISPRGAISNCHAGMTISEIATANFREQFFHALG
jgi:hypothetical protein